MTKARCDVVSILSNRSTLAACALMLVGCIESQFELDINSPLPAWFVLPAGATRADVSVELTYYTLGGAELSLLDAKRRRIAHVRGRVCWHPSMQGKHVYGQGFLVPITYVYVEADGQTQVFEHNKSPIFRVSSDPALLRQARESMECRRTP